MTVIYKLLSEFFSKHFTDDINALVEAGSSTGEHSASYYFNEIGLVVIGIVSLVTILYYIVIDHPRLNKFWHWCIVLLINIVLAGFVSWKWISSLIAQNLFDISTKDFISNFALMNGLIAVIVFFVASMITKFFSNNNRYNPF